MRSAAEAGAGSEAGVGSPSKVGRVRSPSGVDDELAPSGTDTGVTEASSRMLLEGSTSFSQSDGKGIYIESLSESSSNGVDTSSCSLSYQISTTGVVSSPSDNAGGRSSKKVVLGGGRRRPRLSKISK